MDITGCDYRFAEFFADFDNASIRIFQLMYAAD